MSDRQIKKASIDPNQLEALRARLQGSVLVEGDEGYDTARLTWDVKTFDQHPTLVVLPAVTADVQAAVAFAHAHDLPIAVQGGGHGHPYPADDALLVNFANMTAIHIDAEAALARIEPGVLFKALVQAAHADGLAPLNGFAGSVGVVGYMLGGGLGWLARQYGPGAGSIRSVELVTADGNILHVDEHTHPDLLWGLRGGGGNFGIVTALECALYPVKEIFAGQVVYPIEQGKEVLNAYFKWTGTVPDELTSAVRITHFPPSPALPPPLRGASVITVMASYNGEGGEALLSPLRSLETVLIDTFAVIPYSKVATIANDPDDALPLFLYNESSAFQILAANDRETLLGIAGNRASGIFQVEIRQLGGALARQAEDAMAFNCRDAQFYLNVQALAPSPDQLGQGKRSIATLMQALRPDMMEETLINFVESGSGDVGPYLTRAAYTPANYERLRALKERYDPKDVFRFNHNIALD